MINDEGVNRVREQLMNSNIMPKTEVVSEENQNRMAGNVEYPTFCYVEMAGCFFAANFVYHMSAFRRTRSKTAFSVFMLVNAFTSYNLCEFTSPGVHNYYAAAFNNTEEDSHRKQINSIYRRQILGMKWQ